ncbi:MAG: proline--tRNA ligase [Thermoanaerobaculia bacterium]|nr:proline--tRNA ligase [Thermoanaerobaculia bacterium]
MRWSRYFLHTTREVPSDAEVVSHRLMARTGMIKKLAAGIYVYQPLGWRSVQKLIDIVRRQMNRAGAIELAMPSIQPAALWHESGRWEKYGKELLRIRDRHDRDFCFGPTHEEVITDVVRGEIKSYRQLPVNLYQIQTKFRDEIRPRFGLMRGREFLMKDAYSFDVDAEGMASSYEAMRAAYRSVFDACHLDYTVVEADSGTIGGSFSHEFMVLASTGESVVVSCPGCAYSANVERAEAATEAPQPAVESALEEVSTPGAKTVEEVTAMLDIPASRLVKTLLYSADGAVVAVAVRGDHEVNEVKLQNHLDVLELRLASDAEVAAATSAPVGFAGPVGLADEVRLVADRATEGMSGFVVGANRADAHLVGAQWGRDATPESFVDLRVVGGGDPCPRCGTALEESRGIETGHTFQLGSVYSQPMGCTFTDSAGETHPMLMGCYGLGIGRTVAAAIEQNHDEDGVIWPLPLAPFEVLLASLNAKDDAVRGACDALYEQLVDRGVDVLYDDRDERPGVKFNDADLIGIPLRIVLGGRGLANGQAEISLRRDREKHDVALEAVVERTTELLDGLRDRS